MDYEYSKFHVKPGSKVNLKEFTTCEDGGFTKKDAKKLIKENIKDLRKYQRLFYADDRYSMLIVLQAPDAGGKDGVIRHVMSGLNPQGCRVHSFKVPTKHELEHDYMWRHYLALPQRGNIEIFNRSHYENVLVSRVNPQIIVGERIPGYESVDLINADFWDNRYRSINEMERHWAENGMVIIKFFLHLSKEEQKIRLLDRLEQPDKNWKFNAADVEARKQWGDYQNAYAEMLERTSTHYAPWYVIPADIKFFTRVAVGDIILQHFERLDLRFPSGESPEILARAKEILLNE